MHTVCVDFHGKIGRLGDVNPFLLPFIQNGTLFRLFNEKDKQSYFAPETTGLKIEQHLIRHSIQKWQLIVVLNISEEVEALPDPNWVLQGSLSFQLRRCFTKMLESLKSKNFAPEHTIFIVTDPLERDRVYSRPKNPAQAAQWEIDSRGYFSSCDPKRDNFCVGIFTENELEELGHKHDFNKDIVLNKERVDSGLNLLSDRMKRQIGGKVKFLETDFKEYIRAKKEELEKLPDSFARQTGSNLLKTVEHDFIHQIEFMRDSDVSLLLKQSPTDILRRILKRVYNISSLLEDNNATCIRIVDIPSFHQKTIDRLKYNIGILIVALIEQEEVVRSQLKSGMLYSLTVPIKHNQELLKQLISTYKKSLTDSMEALETYRGENVIEIDQYRWIGSLDLSPSMKNVPEQPSLSDYSSWKNFSDAMEAWEEGFAPELQAGIDGAVEKRKERGTDTKTIKVSLKDHIEKVKSTYNRELNETLSGTFFKRNWQNLPKGSILQHLEKAEGCFPSSLIPHVSIFLMILVCILVSMERPFENMPAPAAVTLGIFVLAVFITATLKRLFLFRANRQARELVKRCILNARRNITENQTAIESSLNYSLAWMNLQAVLRAEEKEHQEDLTTAYHIKHHQVALDLCDNYLNDLGITQTHTHLLPISSSFKTEKHLNKSKPAEMNDIYTTTGIHGFSSSFQFRIGTSVTTVESTIFPLIALALPEDIIFTPRKPNKGLPERSDQEQISTPSILDEIP